MKITHLAINTTASFVSHIDWLIDVFNHLFESIVYFIPLALVESVLNSQEINPIQHTCGYVQLL